MGRRGNRRDAGPHAGAGDVTDWSTERTLAAAEADAKDASVATADDAKCPCGSEEFVLEAFMHVVGGKIRPVPVEVEGLTCPQCGREFEVVEGADGRVLRGEFRGFAELDD